MNSRILPLLALLVAAVIFFMYVNPTWSGPIATARVSIASDNEALAAASQYAEQQNDLATARNAISLTDLSRLSTFLPDSVDNVGLILDINALAAHSGLSLSNIDVTTDVSNSSGSSGALPGAGMNPVGSIDLSLSAVGTYAALQNFLQGVERSRRLLDVRELSVRGSDTGVYNYQMSLRLYWLR